MRWYAGSDHAGFPLKQHLVEVLRGLGDTVEDLGTNSTDSVDYPTFGAGVGRRVAGDPDAFGLVVCGTGIGIGIAANKIPGVRCALVHDAFTAEMARSHNKANVIALGARVVGTGVAESAVAAFRAAVFAGGRHQHRIDLLDEMDRARAAAGASGGGSTGGGGGGS